jgi:hypothetical protein
MLRSFSVNQFFRRSKGSRTLFFFFLLLELHFFGRGPSLFGFVARFANDGKGSRFFEGRGKGRTDIERKIGQAHGDDSHFLLAVDDGNQGIAGSDFFFEFRVVSRDDGSRCRDLGVGTEVEDWGRRATLEEGAEMGSAGAAAVVSSSAVFRSFLDCLDFFFFFLGSSPLNTSIPRPMMVGVYTF